MGRRNIEHLPKPARQFRPNLRPSSGFETKDAVAAEDKFRIKKLTRHLSKVQTSDERKTVEQAISMVQSASCCASSRYMRKHRIRLSGHLWQQHERGDGSAVTFTLIPKWGKVERGLLEMVDSHSMLQRLRAALNRAGASRSSGWIVAVVHGEYEPSEGVYMLHFHGYAAGGMVDVIDRLRLQKGFKSKRRLKDAADIQRVSRSRAALDHLPRPLTYVAQGFWPAKTLFQSASQGIKRQRAKHRIKEPMHSEVLLWLACKSLRDIVLLLGIGVGRSGLRPSERRTAIAV